MSLIDIITTLDAHAGAITGIATVILAYFTLRQRRSQDKPILYFTTEIEEITPTLTGKKATIGGREIGDIVKTGDYGVIC